MDVSSFYTLDINNELKINLQKSKLDPYVYDFEEKCDRNLPLFAGLAAGRFRQILRPIVLYSFIAVFIFFVFLYFLFRWFRKRLTGKRKRRKRKKR